MARLHFYEAIERENDYQKEYMKLEKLCFEEYPDCMYDTSYSINAWISNNFRHWNKRSNYISYNELREQLGFRPIENLVNYNDSCIINVDFNKYLLYCEMILTLISALDESHHADNLEGVIKILYDTIVVTIEKAGLNVRITDDEQCIIVENNAVAIEVADKVPELKDVIIEYNHYLLRGDLNRKKQLLRQMADALEPKKNKLKDLNKRQTDDYFYLVNNMNIRHNNCDPGDAQKYNAKFVGMSLTEKEEWYDLIYEQGLVLFVILEQQERNKKIDAYKLLQTIEND